MLSFAHVISDARASAGSYFDGSNFLGIIYANQAKEKSDV